jgi:tellurite resistance protein
MLTDDPRLQLLARVARGPADPSSQRPATVLALCAAAYGARPADEATVPTGFDPHAIALFESIVEAAYLVARADGVFDDAERTAFERVVTAACGGTVAPRQIEALVADLEDQLVEDGLDRRVQALSAIVLRKEHGREVLRIAALLADASDGVSDVEREVLGKIATACGLGEGAVDTAVAEVRAAMASAAS